MAPEIIVLFFGEWKGDTEHLSLLCCIVLGGLSRPN
jgi:hypothetical protein